MPDVQIVSLESHRSSYGTSFWNAPEKKKKKPYQMTRLISWDTSSESVSQIERIFKANNDTKDIQTSENDHRVKNYGINKRNQ